MLVVERWRRMLGAWVRLGREMEVISEEFGALVCSGMKEEENADLWQRKGGDFWVLSGWGSHRKRVEVLGSLRDLLSFLSLEVLLGFCSTGSAAINCRNGGGRRLQVHGRRAAHAGPA